MSRPTPILRTSRLTTLVLALFISGVAIAQTLEVAPGANLPATPDMVNLLPADIKSGGVLNVATTDGNAPWAFVDNDTRQATGVDVDLIDEAARRLGLTVNWDVIQFTAGIPGVQSGRYHFYLSAMADTKAREEVVNFIAYSREASGVVVQKGNPLNIRTLEDLCGKQVAIVTGSLFRQLIEEDLNPSCAQPVIISETADQAAPRLAVASGRADATMDTYGVTNYVLSTATEGVQTQLELSPVEPFAPANQGIAFAKEQSDLMGAVGGALQSMVEDGTYQALMEKWSLGKGGVEHISFNAPLF